MAASPFVRTGRAWLPDCGCRYGLARNFSRPESDRLWSSGRATLCRIFHWSRCTEQERRFGICISCWTRGDLVWFLRLRPTRLPIHAGTDGPWVHPCCRGRVHPRTGVRTRRRSRLRVRGTSWLCGFETEAESWSDRTSGSERSGLTRRRLSCKVVRFESRSGRSTRHFLAFSVLASSRIFCFASSGFWMYRMIALA